MENRITELESRLTFLEHTLNKLNDVIAQQDATLLKLEQQNQVIMQQVKDLDNAVKQESEHEIPPHY